MNRVKELRKKMGLTQTELAEAIGTTQATITLWENQKRAPSFEMLVYMEDVLKTNMNYIMGNSNDPTPPHQPTESDLEALALSELEEEFSETLLAYLQLDNDGKDAVNAIMFQQLKRCERDGTAIKSPTQKVIVKL
ncbi:helix-turn-helix domain-containing protein [Streptococcus fryi]